MTEYKREMKERLQALLGGGGGGSGGWGRNKLTFNLIQVLDSKNSLMRLFDIKELQRAGCFQKLFVSHIEVGIEFYESKLKQANHHLTQSKTTQSKFHASVLGPCWQLEFCVLRLFIWSEPRYNPNRWSCEYGDPEKLVFCYLWNTTLLSLFPH